MKNPASTPRLVKTLERVETLCSWIKDHTAYEIRNKEMPGSIPKMPPILPEVDLTNYGKTEADQSSPFTSTGRASQPTAQFNNSPGSIVGNQADQMTFTGGQVFSFSDKNFGIPQRSVTRENLSWSTALSLSKPVKPKTLQAPTDLESAVHFVDEDIDTLKDLTQESYKMFGRWQEEGINVSTTYQDGLPGVGK